MPLFRIGARYSFLCLSVMTALAAGCGSSGRSGSSGQSGKIRHVVVIMQENRSFDNLFNGFPGADTVQSGSDHGVTVPLQPVSLSGKQDLDHTHPGWWEDWDQGAMDGFARTLGSKYDYLTATYAYGYVPQSETKPLWALAEEFTLADRMFQSNTGPSFVAHQYMIAGQSASADENPSDNNVSQEWGCDAPAKVTVQIIGPNGTDLPGPYPCFDYQTMADLLDSAGIGWRYYAPMIGHGGYAWSAYDAIKHIRFGADWSRSVISPSTKILTDVRNGTLEPVTWVVPAASYSDHPGITTGEGPDWVGNVVNAIGESPFWDSTAILISWDDWGGWYDHVSPPAVDKMGLGFRVPLIVVSPYAKHGYVSHTQHEFGSFLHFIEEAFGLPNLGTRDTMSDDFSDCFDFSQTPQAYVPVPVTQGPSYFLQLQPSDVPPDDD